MRRAFTFIIASSLVVALVTACDRQESKSSSGGQGGSQTPVQAAVPAGFVLDKAPDGTKDLAAVKSAGVKDGEEVIVRGVVGGSAQPFVGGRAVVQIIDPSVTTCDRMPGETCETPWDACCSKDDVSTKSATVQVVDAAGGPLKGTLEGVGGMKPLSEVVVRGKARMEGGKSLVVDATGVYVKR